MIPQDQLFFIASQATALFCGILYRSWDNRYRPIDGNASNINLNARSASKKTIKDRGPPLSTSASRDLALLLLTIPGMLIAWLCYGSQMLHLLILSATSYGVLIHTPPAYVHIATLILALGHLSYLHLDRLVNDSAVYTVDITAPLMVLVQKVTSVGFALYDGRYRAQQGEGSAALTADQAKLAITRTPTPLEYAAYTFNFQTIVCGPMVFYADFLEFIDGTKLKKAGFKEYPSCYVNVLSKIAQAIGCGILIVTFAPWYHPRILSTPLFSDASFLSKLMLVYWVALAARLKYYLAWTLGEAISIASGLGFNGAETDVETKKVEPKWDLMQNIDIFAFENALCQRDGLLIWNRTTEIWLRRTAYDRVSQYKLLATYILSAFWHGFHPGYYITFLLGALFTQAARVARRCLRFRFKESGPTMFSFYHLVTWIATRISMSYLVLGFILLDLNSSIRVYGQLYFFGHLMAGAMIFGLPVVFKPERGGTGRGSHRSAIRKGSAKMPVSGDKLDDPNLPSTKMLGGSGSSPVRRRDRSPRIEESVSEKMSKYGTT